MSFDRERRMKVKDKVCVVTGAAGGIGEAVARRYAKEGAKGVVVADRDADRLKSVASPSRASPLPATSPRKRTSSVWSQEAAAALRPGRRLLLECRHRPRRP